MSLTLNNTRWFATQTDFPLIMQNQQHAGMTFRLRVNSLTGSTIPTETGFLAKVIFDFWNYFNPSGNSAANVELSFGASIRTGSVSLANGVVFNLGLSFDGAAGLQRYWVNAVPTTIGTVVGNTDNNGSAMQLGISTPGVVINYTVDDIFIWNGYTPTKQDFTAIATGTDPATIGLSATKRFRWTLSGTVGTAAALGDPGLKNALGNGVSHALGGDGSDFLTAGGSGTAVYAAPLVWTPTAGIDHAYIATSGDLGFIFFKSLLTGAPVAPLSILTAPTISVNGTSLGSIGAGLIPGSNGYWTFPIPGGTHVSPGDVVTLDAPAVWANTAAGGTEPLVAYTLTNKVGKSSFGTELVTKSFRPGLNMNQDPEAIWGLYMPFANWRLRARGLPGGNNHTKWTTPVNCTLIDGSSSGFTPPTGLWATCWDDLDVTRPTTFAVAADFGKTGVTVTERTDLGFAGVLDTSVTPNARRGIVRVFQVGQTSSSWAIALVGTGTSGNLFYDDLWVCSPSDVDGTVSPVVIDRSDPWRLSQRWIDTCDPAHLGSIRCIDSTIGGNPGSFPVPEYLRSLTDETWGEFNAFIPRVGVSAFGPVDPTLLYQYSPFYDQPSQRYTATLAADITSTTATTITVSDAATAPLVVTQDLHIDSEIMRITQISGTSVTVVRGSQGTTPATHTAGTIQVSGRAPVSIPTANVIRWQITTRDPLWFSTGMTAGSVLFSGPWPTFPLIEPGNTSWGDPFNVLTLPRTWAVTGPNTVVGWVGPAVGLNEPDKVYTTDPNATQLVGNYPKSMPHEAWAIVAGKCGPGCVLQINIPPDAVNDMVDEIGRRVFANYPTDRDLLVEYDNETWNFAFNGFGWHQLMNYATTNLTVSQLTSTYPGNGGALTAQHYLYRGGLIAARLQAMSTALGRTGSVKWLINCQLGAGASAGQISDHDAFLTYVEANGWPLSLIAHAPYFWIDNNITGYTALQNSVSDAACLDLYIHDVYYNPNTYNNYAALVLTAIAKHPGHGYQMMAYEGGQASALMSAATNFGNRAKDIMYHPNNRIIEEDTYAWIQSKGYVKFHLYDYNSPYHTDGNYDLYHGVLQLPGRGDGSDGLHNNLTTRAQDGHNPDFANVSTRGWAFLDWLSPNFAGLVGAAALVLADDAIAGTSVVNVLAQGTADLSLHGDTASAHLVARRKGHADPLAATKGVSGA
jgi:hypothetical protein